MEALLGCCDSLARLSGPLLSTPTRAPRADRAPTPATLGEPEAEAGPAPLSCPKNKTRSFSTLLLRQESRYLRQTDNKALQSCPVGICYFSPRTSPLNPQQGRAGPWESCQFSDFRRESDHPRLASSFCSGPGRNRDQDMASFLITGNCNLSGVWMHTFTEQNLLGALKHSTPRALRAWTGSPPLRGSRGQWAQDSEALARAAATAVGR